MISMLSFLISQELVATLKPILACARKTVRISLALRLYTQLLVSTALEYV